MRSHRSSRWGGVALVLALVAAGCSDDTGILIRIARDPAVPSFAEIPEVEVFVGIADADPPSGRGDWYTGDPDPQQRTTTAGRDLAESPLTLLLSPGDQLPLDAELMVAAIGRRGDDIVAIGAPEAADGSPRTVRFVDGKVVIWDITLAPLDQTSVEVTEEECLRWVSADGTIIVASPTDSDCDDDPNDSDCAVDNPRIHHGATDDCDTDADEDCDGNGHNETNRDGDEFTNCAGDCDDDNRDVFPGAPDKCDGIDNDCDPVTPCDFDGDGDGYTVCGKVFRENDAWVCMRNNVGDRCDRNEVCDCDDGDDEQYPFAPDVCDGHANDCRTDSACDADPDNDGFTACGTIVWSGDPRTSTCVAECPGAAPGPGPGSACDCDQDDPTAGGQGPERCDGLDSGCDDLRYPESTPCFAMVGEKCFAGDRRCDDDGLPGQLDACQPSNDTEVPPQVCTKYAMCEQQPDPYRCMLAPVGSQSCQVGIKDGDVCPQATVALVEITDPNARWRLIGGQNHGPWRVGLRATGSMDEPGLEAAGRFVTFVVQDFDSNPSDGAPTQVIVARFADGAIEFLDIVLRPETVNVCRPGDGMTCTPR